MVWYQVNTSDLQTIGIQQAITTLFAAIGSFTLSLHLDLSKDITLATKGGEVPVEYMVTMMGIWKWTWILSFVVAAGCFLLMRHDIARIKAQHGEFTTLWKVRQLLRRAFKLT